MRTCPKCQRAYPHDTDFCPRDGSPLPAVATATQAELAAGLVRKYRIIRRLGGLPGAAARYAPPAEQAAAPPPVVTRPPRLTGSFLFFADPPVGQPLTLRHELPVRDLVLRHRTRNIRVWLRGDAVMAMDNFGADLTFFDALED